MSTSGQGRGITPLEEKIAKAIAECERVAHDCGGLSEDTAMDIANQWAEVDEDWVTVDDFDEHPDMDSIWSAVCSRFGF